MPRQKHIILNAAAAAALLLAACLQACHPEDRTDGTDTASPAPILFTGHADAVTRTAADGTWDAEEQIRVIAYPTADEASLTELPTYLYKGTSADGKSCTFAPTDKANTAYYPKDNTPVTVVAYAPWDAKFLNEAVENHLNGADEFIPGKGKLYFDLGIQQDFITTEAVTDTRKTNPVTSLQFKHKMMRLTVKVQKNENSAATVGDWDGTFYIDGLKHCGSYDLLSGEWEFPESTYINGDEDPGASQFSYMFFPTPAGRTLTFTVWDTNIKEYTADLTLPHALEEGVHYELTFKMGAKSSITLTGNTLKWNDGGTASLITENTTNTLTIHNLEELKALRDAVNNGTSPHNVTGKTIRLAADIDMTTPGDTPNWKPMGIYSYPFVANFDGMGHTITGMKVNGPGDDAGFFGCIDGSSVKNLILKDAVVKGTYAGTLAGNAKNATITRCAAVNTKVTTTYYLAGGLIENLLNSKLCGCYATGKVNSQSAENAVGLAGLVSTVRGGTLESCYADCKVEEVSTTRYMYDGFFNYVTSTAYSMTACASTQQQGADNIDEYSAGDPTKCTYEASPETIRKVVAGKNNEYIHYWSTKPNAAGTGPALRFE